VKEKLVQQRLQQGWHDRAKRPIDKAYYRGIIAAMKNPILFLTLLSGLLLMTGCATKENNFDPLESMNRKVDGFNTALDNATLRPVAKGYTAVVPEGVRHSVTNFFNNLQEPDTIVNDVLQGKIVQGLADTARFAINTTVGIGGLFDVASHVNLKRNQEDFGQTLAVWGVGQGAYIVYPVIGPSAVRETPGLVTSWLLDLASYASVYLRPEATIAFYALKYTDERAGIEDFVKMRDEMALDAYIFVREGWRQNREYRVFDGNPPAKPQADEHDEFADPFADEFADEPKDEFDH